MTAKKNKSAKKKAAQKAASSSSAAAEVDHIASGSRSERCVTVTGVAHILPALVYAISLLQQYTHGR